MKYLRFTYKEADEIGMRDFREYLENKSIIIYSEQNYEGIGILEYGIAGLPKDFEYFDYVYDEPYYW